MNTDPFHNSRSAAEEIGTQKASSASTGNADPTLTHLARVINIKTRKTPIVKKLVPIEIYHRKPEALQIVPYEMDNSEAPSHAATATMVKKKSPGNKKRSLSSRSKAKSNERDDKRQRVVAIKMEEDVISV